MDYETADAYQNEDQRNVHIWASERSPTNALRVVAGTLLSSVLSDADDPMIFLWQAAILLKD